MLYLPLRTAVALLVAIVTVSAPAYAEEPNFDSWSAEELENELEQTTLGAPITVLAVGGGIFIAGGSLMLLGLLSHALCEVAVYEPEQGYPHTEDYPGHGDTSDDLQCGRSLLLWGLGAAVIGGGLAGGGGIWLGSRIRKRRMLNRALEKYEVTSVETARWELAPNKLKNGGQLELILRF